MTRRIDGWFERRKLQKPTLGIPWVQDSAGWHCQYCEPQFTLLDPGFLLGHLLEHRLEHGADVPEPALETLRRIIASKFSYDSSCFYLADGFLEDVPGSTAFDRACLAQHVQEAVESWLADNFPDEDEGGS